MSPETVATLFGLTLIVALVVVVASFFVPRLRSMLSTGGLALTAAVATGAMAGSLYFSEVADFVPCKLCWYQRIAMYPLAVLLVMAMIRRDRSILRYAIVIASLGLAVSIYHIQIQLFPETSNFCEISNPCTAKWVDAFGVLTIPQMAAMSFVLIIAVSSISLWTDRRAERTTEFDALPERLEDTVEI